jgi:uncharacterized membrane protein
LWPIAFSDGPLAGYICPSTPVPFTCTEIAANEVPAVARTRQGDGAGPDERVAHGPARRAVAEHERVCDLWAEWRRMLLSIAGDAAFNRGRDRFRVALQVVDDLDSPTISVSVAARPLHLASLYRWDLDTANVEVPIAAWPLEHMDRFPSRPPPIAEQARRSVAHIRAVFNVAQANALGPVDR